MSTIKEEYGPYIQEIKEITKNNRRLTELFAVVPEMSVENYQTTSFLYANKKYEEELTKDTPIPHGFYQILEDSIIKQGFLPTLRIYSEQINLIAETLKMDIKELRDILKELRPGNKGVADIEKEQKARQKLKQLLRKFNSIFKENYVKKIVAEKAKLLEDTIIHKEHKKVKSVLTPDNFVKYIFSNPLVLKRVRNIIQEKFYIYPSDALLTNLLMATTKKNYLPILCDNLGIKEPPSWDKYVAEKPINRLETNFLPKLNKMCETFTDEEKFSVLKVIQYQKRCYSLDISHKSDAFTELKIFIKKVHLGLLQQISRLMVKSGTEIKLENGTFRFVFPPRISTTEKIECENYRLSLAAIKSVHNQLYTLYKDQNEVLLNFMNISQTTIPDGDNVEVDKTKWLDSEKIKKLIENLDITAISKMPDKVFNALKKFLLKDGLLWTFLAGNIPLNIVLKIINNFESIYVSMNPDSININNIQEVVKKANLYEYVDDYMIALIGLDNLAKIINYNQFLGVPVTDEIIRKRIRKVVDLAIRSEKMENSSLPFSCNIKSGEYSLSRYHNNDPKVFTCGIDTKTCFSVGVNENDFFFYSLLSKDGYIIKIEDKDGNLVARASCFRRNNVLMINGIRTLNNKVIPENQEELTKFINMVELIKLMAKKMITITSDDKCPIDYVVCNQAGILEHAYFENQFEKVNSQLFREPINVYNDEWQEFVHMYDGEKEQLLQEVVDAPNKSFSTDFGNHYPALLIASRNNMGLLSPRDISMDDQDAIYKRPRALAHEYIGEEITTEILGAINRIRALDYHRCLENGETHQPFKLISSSEDIRSVCIGDDWCVITLNTGEKFLHCSKLSRLGYNEASQYYQKLRSSSEKDVRIYYSLEKNKKKL